MTRIRSGEERSPGNAFHRGTHLIGGFFFLVLTVGVFWYQFRQVGPSARPPEIGQLRWGYLVPILMLVPAETLLSGFRMWMICRVLEPGIRFRDCVRAELANAAMALLTPSQTGGGAGQVYLLTRAGARLGTALTISILSFVGTMVALTGMGVYSLSVSGGQTSLLFRGAAVALTGIAGLILLSLALPGIVRTAISGISRGYQGFRNGGSRIREWRPPGAEGTGPPVDRMGPLAARLSDVLYSYRDDLARFLRNGKAVFLLGCGISLLFLFSRFLIAFLCVRFLGIRGSSLGEVLGYQMVLLFVTYFGPTPGSAGIAEMASLAIMSSVVPPAYGPYYNLLWRLFSAYLAGAAGFLVLLRAVARDMGGMSVRRGGRGRIGNGTPTMPSAGSS